MSAATRQRRRGDSAGTTEAGASGVEPRLANALRRLQRARGKGPAAPCILVLGPGAAGIDACLAAIGAERLTESDEPDTAPSQGQAEIWLSDHATFVLAMEGASGQGGWPALLAFIRKSEAALRPAGVVVCASLADIAAGQAGAVAETLRLRLRDVRETFGPLPVHVLFWGAEALPGFPDFFGKLDQAARRAPWGRLLGVSGAEAVAAAFDAITGRLVEELPERLQDEPGNPAAVIAFPSRFAALRTPLTAFLRQLGEPGKDGQAAALAGFHIASAGQQAQRRGVPADALFLADFFDKVVPSTARIPGPKTKTGPGKWLGGVALAAVVLVGVALAGAGVFSFLESRALIAETGAAIARDRAAIEEAAQHASVFEVDLENIVGALSALRGLPAVQAGGDRAPGLADQLGLSQREKLSAAASSAYGHALERHFRPRVMLEVERIVRDKMTSPGELYEPLKVYLMLGGQAPRVDAELVAAYLRRDWEKSLYAGPANRAGREELEQHLRAMLGLSDGATAAAYLDRQLVEAAQRSLSRMDLADLAWASINSAAYAASLDDFSITAGTGPQSGLVFDTLDARSLATLRVPALYTHAGFRNFFLRELGAVAQKVVDDQWVMGAGGQQVGVAEQLERLGPRLLDQYGRGFSDAWNGVLENLKLRPMTEDREKFAALSAISSPASPLRRLVEAVASETALTRESEANLKLKPEQVAALEQGLRRVGLDLGSGKSQNRAGSAFGADRAPGATIEAQFRSYQTLVSGEAGRRPIDALVQNFADLHQSMVLSASVSAQGGRASGNLQLQVHNLRANASRLPRQLARMVDGVADEFENDVAQISIAQLNQALAGSISSLCEAVIGDTYPFVRGSRRDASIQDFTRLFAPSGEIDRFFAQNLAPLVDISGDPWRWKQDSRVAAKLSLPTLLQFQRAAAIRDAFFPRGGSRPEIALTIAPFSLHDGVDLARLDVNGQVVQSRQSGGSPTEIIWPDAFAAGSAELSLLPALPGRVSGVRFDGPWALMRLMDTGTVKSGPDGMQAQFVLGGRDVSYAIRMGGRVSPFGLPALTEFRCPSRL